MPDGGDLFFNLSRHTFNPDDDLPCPEIEPGDWVKLAVSDTGSGIEADVLPHIFEPFFTTKRVGEGTGLGLAQIYGILNQHGGCITVSSEMGLGTTFTLYFPVMTAQSDNTEGEAHSLRLGLGETVLLVEDDPNVLMVTGSMLETLNYRVLTAVNGDEALEIYRARQDQIAVVLTDLVMPGTDGIALANKFQEIAPELPVLVMTGYAGNNEHFSANIAARLKKPVGMQLLAETLTTLLA
ncbi:MAG: hypothetical protein Kow0031_22170 [Anaerolineae bacterium]